MKKISNIFLSVLLVFSMLPLASASAATNGDYVYKDNGDGTATITDYVGEATDIEIPSTINGLDVVEIGSGAFAYKNLTSVIIPEGIKKINGGGAFHSAFEGNNLTSITLPKSVEDIGADSSFVRTFHFNPLEEVIILGNPFIKTGINPADPFTKPGKNNNDIKFYQPSSPEKSDLQELVRTTSEGVNNTQNYSYFQYNLKKDGTTSLKSFSGVLKNGEIPNQILGSPINEIGYNAFNSTTLKLNKAVIPEGVETIAAQAFLKLDLNEVVFPNSLKAIGDFAFQGNNLTTLILPEGVEEIGSSAFSYNKLEKANIPSSLTEIKPSLFMDNKLSAITIPEGVKSIGIAAFRENNLTSLELPNGIKSIENFAFYKNNIMGELKLPTGIEQIGLGSFAANNFTSVVIPKNMVAVEEGAFLQNDIKEIKVYNPSVLFNEDSKEILGSQSVTPTIVRGYNGSTSESFADRHSYLEFNTLGEIGNDDGNSESGEGDIPSPETAKDQNDVNLNLKGGEILLDMSNKTFNFNVELNNDPVISFDNQTLDYKVTDNRGLETDISVQYTLENFTHENGQNTLIPMDNSKFNTPIVSKTFNPTLNPIINDIITLDFLKFDGSGFVKVGNYHSTITTEVISSPVE